MFAVILDLESGQTAVQTYKVRFKIGGTCTYFRSSQPVHYYGKLYSKVFVILQTKLLNYPCNQQHIEIPLVCYFILNAFTCNLLRCFIGMYYKTTDIIQSTRKILLGHRKLTKFEIIIITLGTITLSPLVVSVV